MEIVRFFMKNLNFLWRQGGGRHRPRTSHTPRNELFACVLGANPRISREKKWNEENLWKRSKNSLLGRRAFLIIIFLSKSSKKFMKFMKAIYFKFYITKLNKFLEIFVYLRGSALEPLIIASLFFPQSPSRKLKKSEKCAFFSNFLNNSSNFY